MIGNGLALTSERAAPSTYATQPTFFFRSPLVFAIIAASRPMPPITTNACSSWSPSARVSRA